MADFDLDIEPRVAAWWVVYTGRSGGDRRKAIRNDCSMSTYTLFVNSEKKAVTKFLDQARIVTPYFSFAEISRVVLQLPGKRKY